MTEAQPGDTVRIEYEGRKAEDNQVIGSSEEEGAPLEFTLGAGEVIPGLEEAVAGMAPGDQKEVEVPPPLAYGERDDKRQTRVPRSALPPGYDPEPGDILEVERDDGARYPVTIVDVEGQELTVDENHPLAGETLEFELQLLEVLEETADAVPDPDEEADEEAPNGDGPEPGPDPPQPDGPGELDDEPA